MALKLRFSRNLVMVAQSKSLSRSVKAASARKKMKTTLNVTSSVSKWRLKVQSAKAAQTDNALEEQDKDDGVLVNLSQDDGVLVNLSQVPQMSTEQIAETLAKIGKLSQVLLVEAAKRTKPGISSPSANARGLPAKKVGLRRHHRAI